MPLVLSDPKSGVLHDIVVDVSDWHFSLRQVTFNLAVWTVILVEELLLEVSLHGDLSLGVAEVVNKLLSFLDVELLASLEGLVISDLEFDLEIWGVLEVSSLQLDLNLVDDLGLWLSAVVWILEFQGGWEWVWEFELELDGIVSLLELLSVLLEVKKFGLEFKSIVLVFNSLRVMMSFGLGVSLIIGVVGVSSPESGELTLLLSLDIKHNFLALEVLGDLYVNHSGEHVSRLIELLVELKTYLPAWEYSLCIRVDLLLSLEELRICLVLKVDLHHFSLLSLVKGLV